MENEHTDFKTEQEKFWHGEFGDKYIERNRSDDYLASNLSFFSKTLSQAKKIDSCIEFGANIGMNLKAIKLLYPSVKLGAIEINDSAAKELSSVVQEASIFKGSIFDYPVDEKYDLVIIKGVLIHINPKELVSVYRKLVDSTQKYLLIAEYYNRTPTAITYRGHEDRLFKRDFAGEVLDNFPEMTLVDYGFSYHRDVDFPQDDISWFLLKKSAVV
jgi:pseudaminic acid biosynthesis-associated methylase